jgi:hypothetical protein
MYEISCTNDSQKVYKDSILFLLYFLYILHIMYKYMYHQLCNVERRYLNETKLVFTNVPSFPHVFEWWYTDFGLTIGFNAQLLDSGFPMAHVLLLPGSRPCRLMTISLQPHTLTTGFSSYFVCCLLQSWTGFHLPKSKSVDAKVMLRMTVSRLICIGVKHPSRGQEQIFNTVRQLWVC